MAATDVARGAHVTWTGNLTSGKGTITRTTSGALGDLPVSWAARTEAPEHKTSPEELIAAAHAACMAMAFSHTLTQQGHTPERLEVDCTVTFAPLPAGGYHIASSHLTIQGKVPGMDGATFAAAARDASCPVSAALQGNVSVTVEGSLLP